MPRPLPLDLAAVEFQAWGQLSDAKALDGILRVADRIAKRMAGRVGATCADGILEPGHGRAA